MSYVCVTGIPAGQPQPGDLADRHEARRLHLQVCRLHRAGQGQGQQHHSRSVYRLVKGKVNSIILGQCTASSREKVMCYGSIVQHVALDPVSWQNCTFNYVSDTGTSIVLQYYGCCTLITDSCKKTGVVCDSVVSSLEFVDCQSVQGQVSVKDRSLSRHPS